MASIRKRKWTSGGEEQETWIVDYRDQHGKRRLKSFQRKKDADAFLVKARHEVTEGTHTPDSASVTVGEAGQLWLEGRKLEGLERSTTRQYEQHLRLHIGPIIGHLKLSRLTTPRVQQVRDELLRTKSRPMAPTVLQSIRMLLSDAHGGAWSLKMSPRP